VFNFTAPLFGAKTQTIIKKQKGRSPYCKPAFLSRRIMNIYFACSITGGREFEPIYQAIVAALDEQGHVVPTSHIASSEVIGLEKIVSAGDIYSRDIQWINEADILVAEVSTPSHGVGYEIGYALSIGKPVFCCYQSSRTVSKMITGNTHPNITVQTYSTEQKAVELILSYLSQISGGL
jgi:hypothetical protein